MKRLFHLPVVLILCAVIALSAVLAGCDQNEKNFPVPLSVTEKSALELCKTQYLDGNLDEIYQSMVDGDTIQQLHKSYPIECLRKTDTGDYCVIYKGSKRVLALLFDENAQWLESSRLQCIYRMTDSRGKLDKLKVGDDVSKVQKIDPTCFFWFIVDDLNGKAKADGVNYTTLHFTEDGYCTRLTYEKTDDSYVIQSITSFVM